MPRRKLPVYNIETLQQVAIPSKEFMTDRFAHYLDEHRDLKFPHMHSFYQLVYFTAGGGNHSIDFIRFPVEAGQIYFMILGQVHSWFFEGRADGFIINFSEHFIQSFLSMPSYLNQFDFFSGNCTEQVILVPPGYRAAIVSIFEKIIEESKAKNFMHYDYLKTAMLQLFITVQRCRPAKEESIEINYQQGLLRKFQQLIDQHFREKKLTKDYAVLLHLTPNYLNALSKQITGRSAGGLIRERVLLEAKRLLVNARMNIAEIAAELEFKDNSYFSKFFRKYEGVSPETFRKQNLNR